MQQTVYLAGPISGKSYGESNGWRQYAIEQLACHGIDGISPMRAKEFLYSAGLLGCGETAPEHPLTSRNGIITRDRFDTMRCDIMLLNVEDARDVSIGSCIELGWADSKRIPVIVVMSEGNPHWHGMVREIAGYIVETLDEAIDIACAILA